MPSKSNVTTSEDEQQPTAEQVTCEHRVICFEPPPLSYGSAMVDRETGEMFRYQPGKSPNDRFPYRVREMARTEGRNDTGVKLALYLRDMGYAINEAALPMARYWEAVNTDEYPEPYAWSECLATLRSVYSKQRRMPPYGLLPLRGMGCDVENTPIRIGWYDQLEAEA